MAVIREAAAADIPRLLELYAQLALDPSEARYARPDPEFNLKALAEMQAAPGIHLLVAEENGTIAGTAMLVILPGITRAIARWAVIEYVVVDENLRGRGIGRDLMDHAAKMAEEAGCYKIMLCSNKKRPDAHRFYRSIGYEQTHEAFHRYFGEQ